MVPAEEAWAALQKTGEEGERGNGGNSVHQQPWPDPNRFPHDPALEESWKRLLELRDQAMKALEEARAAELIGDPLEADLEVLVPDEEIWRFLENRQEALAAACIVSNLRLTRGAGEPGSGVTMKVQRAAGTKCQRCWMRLPTVGRSPEHPGLCHRCVAVLEKLAMI